MRKMSCILLALIVIFVFQNCEDGLVTTGEQDVIVIKNMDIVLTSKSFTSEKLTAKGTIKNNGTQTVYPEWYVEGDFYTDTTFVFKLGGDHDEIPYTLAPGEMTSWTLKFSSSDYLESDYPNFGIKNFRAFRYKEDD